MTVFSGWLGASFAFIFGAIIGSFLNACIYRMPLGISLANPRRSFCPKCQAPIPWYFNLPIISYFWLRGKCAECHTPISPRYPLIETLTATLFALTWQYHSLPLAPIYCFLIALLIVATFIDIDYLIIPDEISLGGIACGLLLSLAVPSMMETTNHLYALGWSVTGAATGYLLLWGVVEGGKLAFGKKKHSFEESRPFIWRREGETAEIELGEDLLTWDDTFSRPSDELSLECESVEISGQPPIRGKIVFRYDRLFLPSGESLDLDQLETFRGTVSSLIIPREAMGFGDVKFLAACGAFLGWKAVLFTIFVASITGCLVGIIGILLRRGQPGTQLPFGPFLAFGAVFWILGGTAIWNWYFSAYFGNLYNIYGR